MTERSQEDIAIVGMSALFSRAPDVDTFWGNILHKVDGIRDPLPAWGAATVFDPSSGDINRIYTAKGGFLNEDSRFNPAALGIMPKAVQGGEPDQFHALQLARDALDSASLGAGFDGERCGVILGHGIHAHRANANGIQQGVIIDQTLELLNQLHPTGAAELAQIGQILRSKLPPIDVDAVPGLVPNVMTGRIANRLDLMGPNYIIDAACASSLIAVEAAMEELRRGRADVMLAGGVNTSTSALVYMVFCQLQALSRNSRIRPFDQGADGTLLGEGAGMLVLKRRSDAQRDGNRIYALLKAVGQSSDGKGKGVMAPRFEGEVLAMRRAYAQSGVDPQSIGLVEAHGTGIPLGDQTEIQALAEMFGGRRRAVADVALGSVKSMIGHCIPAAGSASLIKMALSLHHKVLPPTLCETVSPELGLENTRFYVNTETRPWIHGGPDPRRAAVNAFGFGGVNTHAVLEEYPEDQDAGAAFWPRAVEEASRPRLWAVAADSREALLGHLAAWRKALEAGDAMAPLAAATLRDPGRGPWRCAVVITRRDEGLKKLAQLEKAVADPQKTALQARSGVFFASAPQAGGVALLFPGENSQYPNMLRDLAIHFPVVRRWLDFLDELFASERDLAPSQALFPPPTSLSDEQRSMLEQRLREMDLGSEAVFGADQALFHLLRGFGVEHQALLGHSTGENAALTASGIPRMSREDVGDYIRKMNGLYRRLESSGEIPEGVLLSVGAADLESVHALVDADPGLYLTMDNCTNQFILFGDEAAVQRAETALSGQGAICVRLPMGRAYHTELLRPMASAFSDLFKDVEIASERPAELYSCVTAEPFPADRTGFLNTATDQYMRRVRFRESIERLYRDGIRTFIEVGPSSHLTAFVRDCLRGREHQAIAANDRKGDDLRQILLLLGRLFVLGQNLNLQGLSDSEAPSAADPQGPYLPTDLPFIRLDEAEAERVRDLLGLAAGAVKVDAPGADAEPPAGPSAAAASEDASSDVVAGHFRLMNEFLGQQERVWMAALKKGRESDD